ncbi:efflux RND transporter periplasmic adaptor subunit [candidate division KSB1 bacterium]|nr:efflux RND transporter periplasmic adaptor subunit [candidate division KSB1 bacterium]NIR71958.1 efflux RND transporter periplasmic adaptor subunit [candidate division KSB1 bacterium]NIS24956.1 efflux RND transporter periplasmic adaptor subunit [candidate division KSB1 bacterium]NIT71876.1 efflux RND transporter periplasmic adaptor subunit [candidate division KSB1 bacterium]NIU25607.1 efflux RND transporter periplasmic adaptor subunit [candidate division KSB1 bacterium]
MIKSLFQIAAYVLILALALSSCGGNQNEGAGTNGISNEDSRGIAVETHLVKEGEVVEKVTATGTIFPLHDVLVSSQTSGTVTKVFVQVGDRVQKGAPLVQVDPELKKLALEQAEAKLAEAKSAFEKAKKDFERNRMLFETKDISEFVFENARLQKESAEAAFLMAQANVKMAGRQLRDARIESSVDGFVAARMVELGATVAPGAPIAKVVDIAKVKVKFGVPEKDIVKLSKGQPATITVDAYPAERFTGEVIAVGPQANLSSRSFPVEVLVNNSDFRLKAGMIASVEVETNRVQNRPLLPKSALLERSGETVCFVVVNDKAVQRIPELGLEVGEKIAVVDGLQAGEEVVILGQENLGPGAKVEVKKRHR